MRAPIHKSRIEDEAARVFALVDQMERHIRVRFDAAIAQIRDANAIAALAELLEVGMVDEALALAEQAFAGVAAAAGDAFVAGAQQAAKAVSVLTKQPISFDRVNDTAVDALRRNNLRLIRGLADSQRDAVRAAVHDGITRGVNPIEMAREFRETIGLTESQVRAVNNFRRLISNGDPEALTRKLRDKRFDATLRRAVRSKDRVPLTQEQIDRMVTRYRERYRIYRSQTVARTEALRSVHEGSEELLRQALDAGRLDADELIRQWNHRARKGQRDFHRSMHRQRRLVGEPFTSGRGVSIRYPGDPSAGARETINCTCGVSTRVVPASERAAAA